MTRHASDVVLEAARQLPQPFTLSDLVLAAWQLAPQQLGLPGLEDQWPSDRRVNVCLCGRKSLLARGLLHKRHDGRYEVTEKCLALALSPARNGQARQDPVGQPSAPAKVRLAPDDERLLYYLFQVPAWKLWTDGDPDVKQQITWPAAKAIYDIGDGAINLRKRLNQLGGRLYKSEAVLRNGQVVGYNDVLRLLTCEDDLASRFARQLRGNQP